ncbi:DNA-processing protein DprA, partial [Agrococcus sp. HG114]|uniref:DNA-processing protein DprA n=1 Tax=Agrococcus sp. HG114 TaxID=2969757 RepID=UPI00215B4133
QVVNLDEMLTSTAADGTESVTFAGRQVVTDLVADDGDGFDFRILNADDAAEQLADGTVHAVVTIPADFSARVSSLQGDAPRQAGIEIVTDASADGLATSLAAETGESIVASFGDLVTTGFISGIFGGYGTLAEQLGAAADGADALGSGGAELAGGLGELAGGLDRFYPAGHDELLGRVASTGCVVAEAPSGVPPTRWRFLARNRLIAALSSATVVVEAGSRSGSINTAGHAAALGRPLGAVPGPVTSGSSAGCHRLLREYGAAVVERAEHVVELIDGPEVAAEPLGGLTSDEVRVLDALSARAPRAVDELAVRTGMAPRDVTASLALLELGARACERGSGWVRAPGGASVGAGARRGEGASLA